MKKEFIMTGAMPAKFDTLAEAEQHMVDWLKMLERAKAIEPKLYDKLTAYPINIIEQYA